MSIISQTENVTAFAQEKPFSILVPKHCPAREGTDFQRLGTAEQLAWTVQQVAQSDIIALDLETRGTDPLLPDSKIIGIGLAGDGFSIYFDISTVPEALDTLGPVLAEHPGLIAHNVYFDGGWMFVKQGHPPMQWHMCTYALYRHLAGEGWLDQKWGLKHAETDLLLWAETNDVELDAWLVSHGHTTSPGNARKSEMWRAPAAILGKYCCLDVEATYLLYTEILRPALNRFPGLVEHMHRYMYLISMHIRQREAGMVIDIPKLQRVSSAMDAEIADLTAEFLRHPVVAKPIAEFNVGKLAEFLETEPPRLLVKKIGTEPPQYKKDGTVSKNWEKWAERRDAPAVVSKNWIKWESKRCAILAGELADYLFNLQSGDNLRWLLYEKLGNKPTEFTETGLPSVSGHVLRHMGEAGDILRRRSEITKELSYVSEYISIAEKYGGTIHPSFRFPGTLTGRPSSYEINLLQIPKTKACMECFTVPEGWSLVDLDFCLHPDTEYLTLHGWLKITELREQDHVWQVNPETLQGSWVIPQRIIRRMYSGDMYSIGNRRGHLRVTENHRMLWVNQRTRNRSDRYILNKSQDGVPNSYCSSLMQASTAENTAGYLPTDWELDMACLLQADSSLNKDSGSYTVEVSKPRKRERVRELLGRDGNVHTRHGTQTMDPEGWYGIRFSSPLLRGKHLFLEDLSTECSDRFVQCLSFWDGSIGRSKEISYTTTDSETADQIQRYLVRCGYECKVSQFIPKNTPNARPCYRLYIRRAKGLRLRKGIDDTRKEHYTGLVGCVTVPYGCILVRSEGQTFVTGNCALEPTVAAEVTGDENLMFLYADPNRQSDVYLHYGAQMPAPIGTAIRASGFDPANPTPASIAKAKKECKFERNDIMKPLYLSDTYGSGAGKKHQILQRNGVNLPFQTVQALHDSLQQQKAGVTKYTRKLEQEWKQNRGYIMSPLGYPMAVYRDSLKDVFNRQCQSTGHSILTYWVYLFTTELTRRGINWEPYILDWYDAATVAVPDASVAATKEVMEWGVVELNRILGGIIKFRGTAESGKTLSDVKQPEA